MRRWTQEENQVFEDALAECFAKEATAASSSSPPPSSSSSTSTSSYAAAAAPATLDLRFFTRFAAVHFAAEATIDGSECHTHYAHLVEDLTALKKGDSIVVGWASAEVEAVASSGKS